MGYVFFCFLNLVKRITVHFREEQLHRVIVHPEKNKETESCTLREQTRQDKQDKQDKQDE
jgi:hypothetical protein